MIDREPITPNWPKRGKPGPKPRQGATVSGSFGKTHIFHPDVMRQFGRNMRRIRKEKGITVVDLADRSALNPQCIYKIEEGKLFPISHLFPISKVLGVSLRSLFDRLEQEDEGKIEPPNDGLNQKEDL